MVCVFEGFRERWCSYFEGRGRGEKLIASIELRRGAIALLREEGLNASELARRLKLPARLIYQWQAAEKNKSHKSHKSHKSQGASFYPVKVKAAANSLVLHTPRGYEVQGLELSSLRQWIEQGVL